MWSLQVGGEDVTPYVTHLNLSETASSSQDAGTITVNGTHPAIVTGASVILTDANGNIAWEGLVTTANAYDNSTGVSAATLASNFAIHAPSGNTVSNDVGVIVPFLISQTSIPFEQGFLGAEVGALQFGRVDDGLTALSTLAGCTWRVQNGTLVFVSAALSGVMSIPAAIATAPNTYSAVTVLGGSDVVTRQPLSLRVQTGASGDAGFATFPELSDSGTLAIAAGQLAQRYDSGAVAGSASITGVTLRAGDWIRDSNGITTIAWAVNYTILAGQLLATVQCGFPALATSPVYSQAYVNALQQYPVSRVSGDYVVQGLSATATGLNVNLSAGSIYLGGSLIPNLAATSVAVPNNSVTNILATSSGFITGDPFTIPTPGQAISLYQVTTWNGSIQGVIPLATFGAPANTVTAEFPSGILQADGSIVNVDGAISHTVIPSSAAKANCVVYAEAMITKGSASGGYVFPGTGSQLAGSGIYFFNGTSGYFVVWQSDGNFVLYQNSAGTVTALANAFWGTSDTNPHTLRFSMKLISGSNVQMAFSIDTAPPLLASASVIGPFIGVPISCMVSTGGSTGKLRNFRFQVGSLAPQLSSTPMVYGLPNSMANLVSNITVQTNSPSSGSLQMWFTSTIPSSNPAGSQYPSWMYPDLTGGIYPSASACGSSTTPRFSWTGLGGGGVYTGIAYYTSGSNAGTFQVVYGPSSAQPTDSQLAQTVGDGTLVVVVASATSGSVVPTAGGGGHSFSGGGGRPVN